MRRPKHPSSRFMRPRESGAVLFMSLILLLILTMIGVTVARMQTVEERMAQNEHNHQLAVQAAEAALQEVEFDARQLWSMNVYTQNANGFYTLDPPSGSILPTINWTNPAQVATVNSMAVPGPALAGVPLSQPAAVVVENLPPVAWPGDPISLKQYPPPVNPTFRVTARAWGADGTASATLQSIVH